MLLSAYISGTERLARQDELGRALEFLHRFVIDLVDLVLEPVLRLAPDLRHPDSVRHRLIRALLEVIESQIALGPPAEGFWLRLHASAMAAIHQADVERAILLEAESSWPRALQSAVLDSFWRNAGMPGDWSRFLFLALPRGEDSVDELDDLWRSRKGSEPPFRGSALFALMIRNPSC